MSPRRPTEPLDGEALGLSYAELRGTLRQLRREAGLSQGALGKLAGLSQMRVSRIETGRVGSEAAAGLTLDELERLSVVLPLDLLVSERDQDEVSFEVGGQVVDVPVVLSFRSLINGYKRYVVYDGSRPGVPVGELSVPVSLPDGWQPDADAASASLRVWAHRVVWGALGGGDLALVDATVAGLLGSLCELASEAVVDLKPAWADRRRWWMGILLEAETYEGRMQVVVRTDDQVMMMGVGAQVVVLPSGHYTVSGASTSSGILEGGGLAELEHAVLMGMSG